MQTDIKRFSLYADIVIDIMRFALNTDIITDIMRFALNADIITDIMRFALNADIITDIRRFANAFESERLQLHLSFAAFRLMQFMRGEPLNYLSQFITRA
jgi:hypothetical protein